MGEGRKGIEIDLVLSRSIWIVKLAGVAGKERSTILALDELGICGHDADSLVLST